MAYYRSTQSRRPAAIITRLVNRVRDRWQAWQNQRAEFNEPMRVKRRLMERIGEESESHRTQLDAAKRELAWLTAERQRQETMQRKGRR